MGAAWGIKGGPKCPNTVAKAAEMVAWLKDGGWGSKPTREAQAGSWRRLQEWVRRGQGGARSADDPADRDIQAVDGLGRPDCGTGVRQQVRGKGAARYRVAWHMDHGAACKAWLDAKARRRWLPLDGREWNMVRAASNFTQA